MSFQAVGPEDMKECGPKLVVQDRGTSSLFASAERSGGRPGTKASNQFHSSYPCYIPSIVFLITAMVNGVQLPVKHRTNEVFTAADLKLICSIFNLRKLPDAWV